MKLMWMNRGKSSYYMLIFQILYIFITKTNEKTGIETHQARRNCRMTLFYQATSPGQLIKIEIQDNNKINLFKQGWVIFSSFSCVCISLFIS